MMLQFLKMNKNELRDRLKKQRSKLSTEEAGNSSRQIINHAWPLIVWENIESAHVYLPLKNQHEVDTLGLIRAAWQLKPALKFATTDPLSCKTCWLDHDLRLTQPVPDTFQYGLVIVPLLGFDKIGHRLGYGGGFYDQFLKGQEHALTIGLCYEFGHISNLPIEPHDVPLHFIVTEKQAYHF